MKKNLFNTEHTMMVAELSANHNHDFDLAVKTIRAAKSAGADAIKLQTYTADTMTINCHNEFFTIKHGSPWDGKSYYELYQQAYTPWEWHGDLQKVAQEEGLIFFSTPFDYSATDFLESLDVPFYKIASFEITDIPLIEYIASKGKPVIISTGIATIGEIDDAVSACCKAGNSDIVLLKCTSSYPAPIEDANLKMIPEMAKRYGVMTGLSDHTLGSIVPLTAVSLGAVMVEKHFIIDRNLGGPDASFSMEPSEFKKMVEDVRNVEKALGTVTYDLTEKQHANRKFSRSLFVVADVKAGDAVTSENIRSIRPGDGVAPKFYKEFIGKRFNCSVSKGTPLKFDFLDET